MTVLFNFACVSAGQVRGLLDDQGGDEAGVADIRFTLKVWPAQLQFQPTVFRLGHAASCAHALQS